MGKGSQPLCSGRGGAWGAARALLRALAVWAALLPLGCAGAPELLIVLDPYQRDVLADRGLGPAQILEAARGVARSRLEVLGAEEGAEERLRALVGRLSPRGVYASPLLAPLAAAAAGDFPGVLFFVDGPLPAGFPPPANLRVVRYEAAAAYAEAGRAVGILLRQPELARAVRQVLREREGNPVGILSTRADRAARGELQGFLDGLAQTAPGLGREQRELETLEDRARLRRHLERMRQEGVDIFLIRASGLTGFCLEVLQREGGVAVVEGGAGIDAYSDVLLLSFERDVAAAVRAMAAAASGGPADAAAEAQGESTAGDGSAGAGEVRTATGEHGFITAPVRLRWWGLAPAELEALERRLAIHG